ncbi:ATP-dependent chaperone ClpB [Leptolyngbya sp. FACHB-671]|uniref:ATP-dependent chaperone ClpB n=1 Tax=Leptolyngbya sp. FACHB-671 TaxID=2692812 RepID=UPI001687A5CE|nr:ATP-dependent chaperone ClpB [Leptolyngbya sp. FACHB-671]MBD1867682.1 ATP-dependent chaperone ClpB [Cyanobacteria bacterium FACHB-471]MBD2067391.1 ATP-dependent chaperone ClpB [Leptolyngbya sp. FACHB-671]
MQPTDPSKFTEKAWEAIVKSQDVTRRFKHQQLEVEHLAIALLEQEGLAHTILQRANLDPNALKQQLETFAQRQPKVSENAQLYLGRSLDLMLDRAEAARQTWQDEFISVEHLLLGMAEYERVNRRFPRNINLDPKQLEAAAKVVRGSQRVTDQSPEGRYDALERYGRDLTEQAKEDRLDPVIGRDEEIRRVVQVLSRRTKNNPVLIGEPGVGKTAIAEGLAQRIIKGDVPESLKNRRLITLDMGSLIAGAKYRGEFEDRLRAVLREVTNSDGQIVLFIDELHSVVGAGASQGTMDAGNLLKPMLARGELRCIGATTLDEYRKHIEKDAALERRFQQVYVGQPSVEDTISILRGLKERYEKHHEVSISDSALVAAATLSDRYISDRFLPDKAIDLVDEAAAKLKMESTSKPEELETIDRRIMQLEMEQFSLQKEGQSPGIVVAYRAAKDRLERIESEISELKQVQQKLNSQWESEKQMKDEINALREEEEKLRRQIEKAERDYDLNTAAQLKYGRLEVVHRELEAKEATLIEIQERGSSLLKQQVTEADIAEIVAKWTSIPVNRLMESERQKLLQLETYLHERVVGQQEAVEAVAAAIRRARAGMKDPGRPIGSFLFMGPTGVGKTELARALAESLFDTGDSLVRLDMSEYMEKHSVSRLVGAPPGYVGYEEGGQLSEAIRRHPYSVLLLDEVEKAHPDVFNILLQVLDDGRITDSQGRAVDFRNTVIVMTSNIGSDHILDVSGDDSQYELMRKRVTDALRSHFRPEFLNRVDDIILFHPLRLEELRQIVGIQLQRIHRLLADQKITLELTPTAQNYIAEVGFDPVYGARPLKRAIQKELENPIATKILENTFIEGDTILIDLVDHKLTFNKRKLAIEEPTAIVPQVLAAES